jgi:hypothetical protein
MINEYIKNNRIDTGSVTAFCSPAAGTMLTSLVRCADGFHMSVQASCGHCCSPRDDFGPWTKVEVGFPSQECDDFLPYAINAVGYDKNVFGWVPVEVVEKVISEHGGIVMVQ